MIDFDTFIMKWNGKPIDWDGIYPNQCMDLMHFYAYECLGIRDKTVLATPAAYQVYTEFIWPEYFSKVPNTPEGVPEKGDIVVFGQAVGQWGHVCMAVDGDVNKFRSFDSNWPVGSLPHIQEHNYNGVLGWLRPTFSDYKTEFEELSVAYGKLRVELENKKKELLELKDKYAEEIGSKTKIIEEMQKSASEMALQMSKMSDTLSSTQNQLKSLSEACTSLEGQVKDLLSKNKLLEEKVKKKLSTYTKWELISALFGRM